LAIGSWLHYLKEFPSPRSGVDLLGLLAQIGPLYRELEEGNDPYERMESSPPRLAVREE